jgi:hypothetical protein
VSWETAGRYQRTPVPPLWSFRWLAWTAIFASQIGVFCTMFVYDVGRFRAIQFVAVLVAIFGTVLAAKQVHRGNLYARQLWTLCDNVYGPAADGATVVIRPSPHPEVPGEVVVSYPDD